MHRTDLNALISRASEDGRRAYYHPNQDAHEKLIEAISDFENRIPYPTIWYVYRSRYLMALRNMRVDKRYRMRYNRHDG